MDICLLHFSCYSPSTEPRVYVNPYYQPATDGAYDELVSGDWRTDFRWKDHEIIKFFKTNDEYYNERLKTLENK